MNRIITVILGLVLLMEGGILNALTAGYCQNMPPGAQNFFLTSPVEHRPGDLRDNHTFESYKGTVPSSRTIVRDGNDQVIRQYIYGNGIDELIRIDVYNGGTVTSYYVHTDAMGSVTAITDANGNLIERVTYDLYGVPTFWDAAGNIIPESLIGNNILFQGREYEPELNLYYFRARYFDPTMGRFLQTDPMGYQDSMNLYQGFNMNPINFLDPFGLEFTSEQVDQLVIVRRDQGFLAAKNWIDQNVHFTNADRLVLHMKLLVSVYDPEIVEAEKYKTNFWTVLGDTVDGIGYDMAGKTYSKLAAAALYHDDRAFASFLFDLTSMGIAGGVMKHYIPIGIEYLKSKFPILNKNVGQFVDEGAEEIKNFFNRLFGGGEKPKIHMGKQGKHIPGHNNYVTGRSILTADPNELRYMAGKGTPVGNIPRGQPGFRERVDFKKVIGYFVDKETKVPTTMGIIKYAKDGSIHIVPARPK